MSFIRALYFFATFFPQTVQQPFLSAYLVKLQVPAVRQLLVPPVAGGFTGGREICVVPPEDVLATCVVVRVPDPVPLPVDPAPDVGDVAAVADVDVWDVDPVCPPLVGPAVEPVPVDGGEMVTGG